MNAKRVRNRTVYNQEFNRRHKEEIKEKKHKYYLANKERTQLRCHQYYLTHKKEYATLAKKSLEAIKLTVFTHYAGGTGLSCARCGIDDIDVLTIDHINGGGNAHRKQLGKRGGNAFYQWLQVKGFPKGYQVLCRNCDWKKRLMGLRDETNTTY